MKKIISIICALFAVLSINSTAWAEEQRPGLWQFTIEEQCRNFFESKDTYYSFEFFEASRKMYIPENQAQADQWFAECVQSKRTYLDGLKATLEKALEGERPVFSPTYSSQYGHKGLQLAVRELVLRYMAEPDAKLLFEKISKKWAPAVYFLFSLDEYPDFREPAMAASATILEGGFAPPDVAAQRYGLRSEEPICKIDMRACATPQSWERRVYDRPDLDTKVYAIALEYKKKLRDPAIPLYEKADAYIVLLHLLQSISKTTDTSAVKGDDFLEPLRFFNAYNFTRTFKFSYLQDRMDSPAPPSIDALQYFFALGWAVNSDYAKAFAYLPDTAVARHFAACSIATAFLYQSGAEYVLSQWGYNTWAVSPTFSLVKITPEVRSKAKSWSSDTPADAEALQNELMKAQDGYDTVSLIRDYAVIFCQYPETYPALAALYFHWKEKGLNERARAEILAVLNHTDAIPVAEYIRVLKDPHSGRILRYAAAGALYTLKVPATEKDLLELYAIYGKKPEDDILLANIVLAFRRTGDTPLRQELFAGIMQKPGYPFTKRQIRIIRHGKDIEEIFAETNKEETPERQAFFNAVDVPFRLDLYEAAKDGKQDDRPYIMFQLSKGISILYYDDNPDLEMAKRLFDALETEAANSKTPSTAFAARVMLSDVVRGRRVREDFPHLEKYRKFYAEREIDKLRPGKIRKF